MISHEFLVSEASTHCRYVRITSFSCDGPLSQLYALECCAPVCVRAVLCGHDASIVK